MMDCKKVKKLFRVVGIKGSGVYADFGTEVPKLGNKILIRKEEIKKCSGTEIALFEPKRDANHLKGHYFVGLIVNERLSEVPVGMDYIEMDQNYATTRGGINNIGNLHNYLMKWSDEQGYKRNLDSYIVETYHPMENGEEEVEIYLPIHI
ncbi:GyrI-like domain-containing protein [Psychrobacillus sp. FSL H8-0484]|uniref:GyrI-like domain-containing protein n=1 Tax=Psychrobacillus sp. FSL H8-0484 TaxID=2921390 RepID=UPI0030F71615